MYDETGVVYTFRPELGYIVLFVTTQRPNDRLRQSL